MASYKPDRMPNWYVFWIVFWVVLMGAAAFTVVEDSSYGVWGKVAAGVFLFSVFGGGIVISMLIAYVKERIK